MESIALVLGLLASALIVTLSLAKSQRSIALISVALSSVLVGQYLALDQPVATALSTMSLIYGALVYATLGKMDSFSRAANSRTARFLLLGVYTVVFAVLNGGIGLDLQLLAYLGSVLMVAVMMVEGAWLTKLVLLAAGICWTIFQFQTGAYGNLVGQIFYFAGLGWSSWKLLKLQQSQRALSAERPRELVAA